MMRGEFKAKLNVVQEMTDNNDHIGAYIAGTELLIEAGAPGEQLLKKFQLVQQLQQLEGSLPHGLNDYRYSLYEQMKNLAVNVLNDDDYQNFYQCF